ncbi:Tip elongation protein 1 [Cytospora mali]|uniref:Tip elongation protein 1 n=1 Tax=Cytospora mali TaxID=578113 RepID=A0A194UQM2_CYTMA|nr:Tip elongation protein 1 [Valsa mali var. pyri (nom. inval.)]
MSSSSQIAASTTPPPLPGQQQQQQQQQQPQPQPPPPHNASPAPQRTLRRLAHKPSGLGRIATASTPNLSGLYSAHSKLAPPHSLQRKASQATLTSSSLAAIPDATESYALASLNGSPSRKDNMPITPRPAAAGDDVSLGDTVDVPGNMYGTIRFVGTVQGKKGTFAGVELHPEFASRGKNSGDVDGVSYFSTRIPGAGIFLPLSKAVRRDSPTSTTSSFPMSPALNGLKAGTQNSTNNTPPTASLPQFSKSVGPGRASSPLGKKSRPSLHRPESPARRLTLTSASRPTIATPSGNLPRYGSPTHGKFSRSMHGAVTPEPAKRGMLQPSRNFSIGPRSTSALSGHHTGHTTDEETTPVDNGRVSPIKLGIPPRHSTAQDEEIERLRAELEDRDKHLKEQAANLAEMESSLVELQSLMEQAEMPEPARRGSLDDKDTPHLRALVKEKNEKIAMLTAEFDAHRADFRSTIDTLELASSETERVYEKRIEELMHDIQQIQERNSDVDVVATQLKQLEELVQELEEGLEDARRGEAEARGEVEFLRGEVERTRTELRREREKAAEAANGTNGATNGDHSGLYRELEEKEDEIRGLKAIIHSLSRDSVPGDVDGVHLHRSESHDSQTGMEDRIAREKLEREVAELRALLDSKNNEEDGTENDIDALRRGSAATLRGNSITLPHRSSARDSRDTIVLARDAEQSSPEQPHQKRKSHSRVHTMETMPESDALSSVTENSTLWCELCETSGHDILTCTNMFGNQGQGVQTASSHEDELATPMPQNEGGLEAPQLAEDDQYKIAPLTPRVPAPAPAVAAAAAEPAVDSPEPVKMIPNLNDPGPVAGKETGTIDPDAWCAVCEKDGHNSVDCPFEDAF